VFEKKKKKRVSREIENQFSIYINKANKAIKTIKNFFYLLIEKYRRRRKMITGTIIFKKKWR
jgi:hypothetical protein